MTISFSCFLFPFFVFYSSFALCRSLLIFLLSSSLSLDLTVLSFWVFELQIGQKKQKSYSLTSKSSPLLMYFSVLLQVTHIRQEYENTLKSLMPASLRQELEDTIVSLKSQVNLYPFIYHIVSFDAGFCSTWESKAENIAVFSSIFTAFQIQLTVCSHFSYPVFPRGIV